MVGRLLLFNLIINKIFCKTRFNLFLDYDWTPKPKPRPRRPELSKWTSFEGRFLFEKIYFYPFFKILDPPADQVVAALQKRASGLSKFIPEWVHSYRRGQSESSHIHH